MKPHDAYEITRIGAARHNKFKDDSNLGFVKQVVQDIKEGKRSSHDWFKAMEEVMIFVVKVIFRCLIRISMFQMRTSTLQLEIMSRKINISNKHFNIYSYQKTV